MRSKGLYWKKVRHSKESGDNELLIHRYYIMKKVYVFLSIVVLTTLFVGCNTTTITKNDFDKLQERVDKLERFVIGEELMYYSPKIDSLQDALDDAKSEIKRLNEEILIIKSKSYSKQSSSQNSASKSRSSTSTSTSNNSERRVSVSSSGRCQAITQKGTQCKRKAKSGSIYCWQHDR